MTILNKSQTNRLLGYPIDARLQIINADDFGMCHAINEAVLLALKKGVLRSTTLNGKPLGRFTLEISGFWEPRREEGELTVGVINLSFGGDDKSHSNQRASPDEG